MPRTAGRVGSDGAEAAVWPAAGSVWAPSRAGVEAVVDADVGANVDDAVGAGVRSDGNSGV